MKFSPLRVSVFPLGFLAFAAISCHGTSAPISTPPSKATPLAAMVEPEADRLWTSTREVRALLSSSEGVWAATGGGVLHFDGHKWRKWTRLNGLPTNEGVGIFSNAGKVVVRFPTFTSTLTGGVWVNSAAPIYTPSPKQVQWKGQVVRVSLEGLQVGKTRVPLPATSTGTHISDIRVRDAKTLLVAIYGDGLWLFDGIKWTRAYPDFPAKAREVTAVVENSKNNLWIGTRRDGIFGCQKGKWTSYLQPDEPFSHNVQNLTQFRGVLWASILDDGLIYRTGNEWKNVSIPTLSSSAPRQMVVWKNRLYVRHGGGRVDSFDGSVWTKNDLANIPRKGVYALASDADQLYAAGWGGWSEWNGSDWTTHFDIPELKDVPILGLLLGGDDVWVATQSRGLGCWNRKSGAFRWFDERDGLSDDWITALAKIDGKIYAGTFAGGLARLDADKWMVFEELKGQNVTSIEADGRGGVYAATRRGLWHIVGAKATKVSIQWLDDEQQALLATKSGLWIGARTSLNFLKRKVDEPNAEPEASARAREMLSN